MLTEQQQTFKQEISLTKTIPIIDIQGLRNGDETLQKLIGKQIDDANRNIGFFMIKNSGISQDFIQETLQVCEKFFQSDLANKMKCRDDGTPESRAWGYFPTNFQILQRSNDIDKKEETVYLNDLNESFNMQNDDPYCKLPPRVFPDHPEEFKTVLPKYWQQCNNLAKVLIKGFSLALDLPINFFSQKWNHTGSVMRLLHYPEKIPLEAGQFRASEHTDYGGLTILYSTSPGLQVKTRWGEWLDINIPKDHFVINIGDLMAFWTNDRWVSTPHRVVAKDPQNPHKRYSLVFFADPDMDTEVTCIPTCESETNPVKYPTVISGDFILKKFGASVGQSV